MDGNPCLTYKVEVRGRELEVFNQAWPIHVRPEDLDWVVGELFEAAQAKQETKGATSGQAAARPGLSV